MKEQELITQYEKIMNTLTPLLVADKLKEIKKQHDSITLKK